MTVTELCLMATCGLGIWLFVQGVPTPAPPSLADRVAPYLLRGQTPFPAPLPRPDSAAGFLDG